MNDPHRSPLITGLTREKWTQSALLALTHDIKSVFELSGSKSSSCDHKEHVVRAVCSLMNKDGDHVINDVICGLTPTLFSDIVVLFAQFVEYTSEHIYDEDLLRRVCNLTVSISQCDIPNQILTFIGNFSYELYMELVIRLLEKIGTKSDLVCEFASALLQICTKVCKQSTNKKKIYVFTCSNNLFQLLCTTLESDVNTKSLLLKQSVKGLLETNLFDQKHVEEIGTLSTPRVTFASTQGTKLQPASIAQSFVSHLFGQLSVSWQAAIASNIIYSTKTSIAFLFELYCDRSSAITNEQIALPNGVTSEQSQHELADIVTSRRKHLIRVFHCAALFQEALTPNSILALIGSDDISIDCLKAWYNYSVMRCLIVDQVVKVMQRDKLLIPNHVTVNKYLDMWKAESESCVSLCSRIGVFLSVNGNSIPKQSRELLEDIFGLGLDYIRVVALVAHQSLIPVGSTGKSGLSALESNDSALHKVLSLLTREIYFVGSFNAKDGHHNQEYARNLFLHILSVHGELRLLDELMSVVIGICSSEKTYSTQKFVPIEASKDMSTKKKRKNSSSDQETAVASSGRTSRCLLVEILVCEEVSGKLEELFIAAPVGQQRLFWSLLCGKSTPTDLSRLCSEVTCLLSTALMRASMRMVRSMGMVSSSENNTAEGEQLPLAAQQRTVLIQTVTESVEWCTKQLDLRESDMMYEHLRSTLECCSSLLRFVVFQQAECALDLLCVGENESSFRDIAFRKLLNCLTIVPKSPNVADVVLRVSMSLVMLDLNICASASTLTARRHDDNMSAPRQILQSLIRGLTKSIVDLAVQPSIDVGMDLLKFLLELLCNSHVWSGWGYSESPCDTSQLSSLFRVYLLAVKSSGSHGHIDDAQNKIVHRISHIMQNPTVLEDPQISEAFTLAVEHLSWPGSTDVQFLNEFRSIIANVPSQLLLAAHKTMKMLFVALWTKLLMIDDKSDVVQHAVKKRKVSKDVPQVDEPTITSEMYETISLLAELVTRYVQHHGHSSAVVQEMIDGIATTANDTVLASLIPKNFSSLIPFCMGDERVDILWTTCLRVVVNKSHHDAANESRNVTLCDSVSDCLTRAANAPEFRNSKRVRSCFTALLKAIANSTSYSENSMRSLLKSVEHSKQCWFVAEVLAVVAEVRTRQALHNFDLQLPGHVLRNLLFQQTISTDLDALDWLHAAGGLVIPLLRILPGSSDQVLELFLPYFSRLMTSSGVDQAELVPILAAFLRSVLCGLFHVNNERTTAFSRTDIRKVLDAIVKSATNGTESFQVLSAGLDHCVNLLLALIPGTLSSLPRDRDGVIFQRINFLVTAVDELLQSTIMLNERFVIALLSSDDSEHVVKRTTELLSRVGTLTQTLTKAIQTAKRSMAHSGRTGRKIRGGEKDQHVHDDEEVSSVVLRMDHWLEASGSLAALAGSVVQRWHAHTSDIEQGAKRQLIHNNTQSLTLCLPLLQIWDRYFALSCGTAPVSTVIHRQQNKSRFGPIPTVTGGGLQTKFGALVPQLAWLIRSVVEIDHSLQSLPEESSANKLVVRAYQLLARIFTTIAGSSMLEKHVHFVASVAVEALSTVVSVDSFSTHSCKRGMTISTACQENLYAGVFSLFEKCKLKQKTQMFALMNAKSRSLMTEMHAEFMSSFKFTGK